MSESYVIDSSAFIALVYREAGAEAVEEAFQDENEVFIGAVNVGEVVARMLDRGITAQEVDQAIAVWPATTVDFTHDLAIASGRLRPATRHLGLSLGDRSCLALAASLNVPVLTADRPWADLAIGVDIRLIR